MADICLFWNPFPFLIFLVSAISVVNLFFHSLSRKEPARRFKIRIRKHEVGLWFGHGDSHRALAPGKHWLIWPVNFWRNFVQRVNVLDNKFEHPMLEMLLEDDRLRDMLVLVDLADNERALIWKDGRLGWILGPARLRQAAILTPSYASAVQPFTPTHPAQTLPRSVFSPAHRRCRGLLS